jgi:hypothetical protein
MQRSHATFIATALYACGELGHGISEYLGMRLRWRKREWLGRWWRNHHMTMTCFGTASPISGAAFARQSESHEYELLIVDRPGLGCQLAIRHINFLTIACASESASPALLKEVIRRGVTGAVLSSYINCPLSSYQSPTELSLRCGAVCRS